GTPTFLQGGELTLLMHELSQNFKLSDKKSREFSIEIDPRTVTGSSLALLKGLGFNRLSFGVQDFDPKVQAAVNRVNSAESIQTLVDQSRDLGFQSINLDLLYGLPLQSEITLADTLEKVIRIKPDRIALYNYAHMPALFKSQKALNKYPMPSAQEKTRLFKLAIQMLCDAGYKMIGMDHFVLEGDELYTAQHNNKLQRNFQGYSVKKAGDLIGLGVSAISQGDRFIHQNSKKIEDYYQHLDRQQLPIEKDMFVDDDDLKRRYIIMPLMTQSTVDIKGWEAAFNESFSQYFHQEIQNLSPYIQDELISLDDNAISILPKGHYFIRQISNEFDGHRNKSSSNFSKAL
ncbi:MAG: oxygen-independent coproporphyrinogen III oxidase, partial [Sinobacterium sp.]|nr:oxygen-independent coproporphyrinogen III oxidase [Sinobacterium sp.]